MKKSHFFILGLTFLVSLIIWSCRNELINQPDPEILTSKSVAVTNDQPEEVKPLLLDAVSAFKYCDGGTNKWYINYTVNSNTFNWYYDPDEDCKVIIRRGSTTGPIEIDEYDSLCYDSDRFRTTFHDWDCQTTGSKWSLSQGSTYYYIRIYKNASNQSPWYQVWAPGSACAED